MNLTRRIPNEVEAKIVGGLGNQLFIFFAAYAHAMKFSKKLTLDFSENHSSRYLYRSSIQSFKFSGNFQSLSNHKNTLRNKYLEALCRRSYIVNSINFYFTGTYCARGLGYDIFLDRNPNIARVSGYFQSYKYFESLLGKGSHLSFDLNQKSEWYKTLSVEILAKQVISIHVRRGDYVNEQSSIGLLSREYYEKAISYLQESLPESELWVFSDDIVEAKKCLEGISSLKTLWLVPPNSADPAESLLLMSQSAGIVIANSSFSWWAAATGNTNKYIVAPSPWFKDIKEPQFLIPDSWYRVESYWQ